MALSNLFVTLSAMTDLLMSCISAAVYLSRSALYLASSHSLAYSLASLASLASSSAFSFLSFFSYALFSFSIRSLASPSWYYSYADLSLVTLSEAFFSKLAIALFLSSSSGSSALLAASSAFLTAVPVLTADAGTTGAAAAGAAGFLTVSSAFGASAAFLAIAA